MGVSDEITTNSSMDTLQLGWNLQVLWMLHRGRGFYENILFLRLFEVR